MKKIAAALAIVAAFLALTGFGFGPAARHHGPLDPAKLDKYATFRLNDLLDDLDASPEQRAQVLKVKDRMLADAKPLVERRQSERGRLLELMKADRPDAQKVHAEVDAHIDELRALAHKAVDAGLEIHSVLTPAQRQQLVEMVEQHHAGQR